MPSTDTRNAIYVKNLSVRTADGKPLLSDISFSIPRGTLTTIVGPSGCGKSTLIRTLVGIVQPTDETIILYAGHGIGGIKTEFPLAVSYLPQFGTFHGDLTVREILHYALELKLPPSISAEIRQGWLRRIVGLARISALLDQRFSTLSGGQMRRVALAEELLGDPPFLLLDELTTGLDVFSDEEIMTWLKDLAHNHGKTIVLVTHTTEHLEVSDSIIFINEGRLIHFGDYSSILRLHKASSIKELFGMVLQKNVSTPIQPCLDCEMPDTPSPQSLRTDRPPNGWLQFLVLVKRQALLLSRDKAQLGTQIALILIFPLLVAIFATDGLPQVRTLLADSSTNIVRSLEDRLGYLANSGRTSSLISGLVLFQVILLTLLGANNGAREIARERDILRKELFSGLSPTAYMASKFVQVFFLCSIQAFWMAWFVKTVCGFPGTLLAQFGILFATALSMSAACLTISAAAPSAERASLLSIYMVGFQLPLSGAALALPNWLAETSRPFVAAYWGWSGYLRSLNFTPYFDLVTDSTQTWISRYSTAILVLALHVVISLAVATTLLRRAQTNQS